MIALLAVVGFIPCFGQVVVVYKVSPTPVPRRAFLHQAPPPRPHHPLPPPRHPFYMPPREIDVRPVFSQKRGRTIHYLRNQEVQSGPVHKRIKPRMVPPTPTGRMNKPTAAATIQKNPAS